ncbi:MAG TPA: HD-GYP domain-containing protein, partial [Nitrospirota bacterium]|nr:HD-GYP domain-containing protein [Nitrospirota bacterium]
ISALAQAVVAKDPYTLGHSDRVTQCAIAVGEEMGLSVEDLRVLRYGATLHDLGKIGISEAVLNKPGRLTDEEYDLMKGHSEIGENIVRGVDFLARVRPLIRHHQERWDGGGYPDGLKGDEIPLLAAIVTVADNFDALTSDRPYRTAKRGEEAIRIIREGSGTKYNPAVVEAFLMIFGEGSVTWKKTA